MYVPISFDGCREIIRMLSYLAVTPSLRYWMVVKVAFIITVPPSFVHVKFVGGDPEEEQFKVKTVAELSSNDKILTGAVIVNLYEKHNNKRMSTLLTY